MFSPVELRDLLVITVCYIGKPVTCYYIYLQYLVVSCNTNPNSQSLFNRITIYMRLLNYYKLINYYILYMFSC